MATIALRTLILYFLILVVMRIMGKRQLGELQPFELVITLIIADLAQSPLTNTGIPLLYGILPILSLFLIHEFCAYMIMKSRQVNNIMCGKPTIVIDKGIINIKELKKMRYTVIDLIEQLRVQSIFSVMDVEYAILETNGELSIVQKSGKRQLTPDDMNIKPLPPELVMSVIIDGSVLEKSLVQKQKTRDWLEEQLKSQRIKLADVLLAQLGDRQMHIQLRQPQASWRVIEVGK